MQKVKKDRKKICFKQLKGNDCFYEEVTQNK